MVFFRPAAPVWLSCLPECFWRRRIRLGFGLPALDRETPDPWTWRQRNHMYASGRARWQRKAFLNAYALVGRSAQPPAAECARTGSLRPGNQGDSHAPRQVDQEQSCQADAKSRGRYAEHVFPRRPSSLRFVRIFSPTHPAAPCHIGRPRRPGMRSADRPTLAARPKSRPRSRPRVSAPIPRAQRGAYRNARSDLRPTNISFLYSRSSVVITVVYPSGRSRRWTTLCTLLSPCVRRNFHHPKLQVAKSILHHLRNPANSNSSRLVTCFSSSVRFRK